MLLFVCRNCSLCFGWRWLSSSFWFSSLWFSISIIWVSICRCIIWLLMLMGRLWVVCILMNVVRMICWWILVCCWFGVGVGWVWC